MKHQKVLDVRVISANPEEEYYWVSYLIEIKPGLLRRTKALYSKGKLNRDSKNRVLLAAVKKSAEEFKAQSL
jgi:hypothetical protein